jgi:hypothetical protein
MGKSTMSQNDDDRPRDDGVHESTAEPPHPDGNRRRKRVVLGAIGLAAVLGAGAYLIADQAADHKSSPGDTGALAPAIAPTSPPPAGPSAAPLARASASASPATPSGTTSPAPNASVAEEIRRAREQAAKDGHPVQRPLTAAADAETGAVSERSVARPAGGSLRVITAKFDLTGQRELLWAADKGKPVGDARCTQNVRFSEEMKPAVHPNLLLCWRTSADRSVATVLVDQSGTPSTAESVQIINHEWAKLG